MTEALPLIMFAVLTVLLMFGFPVAFTLLGTSLIFGLVGFGWDFFNLLPMRIWGIMNNFTLIAVPLFIFMGVMLERSGLAEDLLETMALLFGRMCGGLAVSVVIVGMLLGASTGIVGATVVTMGLISLPTMLRRGYQTELSTGVISASGTLGQIIPPSIVLILLGDIIGVSVGELFMGAVIPGMVLVGLYCLYIIVYSHFNKTCAPAIPDKEWKEILRAGLWTRVVKALIPPLLLMTCVLGSIFAGVASPTEAAAVGAAGAMILSIANGRFTFKRLQETMTTTTVLTCMVFIILVGASAFGLVFRGLGGDHVIRDYITHLAFGKWTVMLIVMSIIFVIGFFLDFIEITFIHIPVLAPIMADFGFDPLWFAILFAVNLQTSFMTPPFGFSLFYLKGVAPPQVKTGHIYKGIIPFVILQLIGLSLVVIFPEMATWLPRAIFSN
ncbi:MULTISPECIES: TRAP transporter large permease subunit [unclassified Pseudodesulfovibrio]|uniref:TRAP transporter large permease n=1 Tax=unclassified Pseudodesulfovibrio TaxID=2661612 RepID=UPI000FEBB1F3|nr:MULTISPECIES: TRAP transporter large permease subunit [unclassified Pseudodesulfovibrio]MCJ2165523.1 TRAP transporter large permease subunit [Pseudodesulfovibrio sp. S3-i]RWU03115.1 C4-dicarboxylate ABC transporter [Pseudodesulfovibrio sp. S3]